MRGIKKVPLFYFYEKSVKKSSFGGPGGSAQNPRKNGPKHTFFLLYRRKIGQKVVKTWSESRGILIFQEGAFFHFFHDFCENLQPSRALHNFYDTTSLTSKAMDPIFKNHLDSFFVPRGDFHFLWCKTSSTMQVHKLVDLRYDSLDSIFSFQCIGSQISCSMCNTQSSRFHFYSSHRLI